MARTAGRVPEFKEAEPIHRPGRRLVRALQEGDAVEEAADSVLPARTVE